MLGFRGHNFAKGLIAVTHAKVNCSFKKDCVIILFSVKAPPVSGKQAYHPLVQLVNTLVSYTFLLQVTS